MITAYVLINIEDIDPILVAQQLNYLEEVDNVHHTTGDYELISRVNAENLIELRENVLKKIEDIQGVVKTTMLIVED